MESNPQREDAQRGRPGLRQQQLIAMSQVGLRGSRCQPAYTNMAGGGAALRQHSRESPAPLGRVLM